MFIKPQIHNAYLLSNLSYFIRDVPKRQRNGDETGQQDTFLAIVSYTNSRGENFNLAFFLKKM